MMNSRPTKRPDSRGPFKDIRRTLSQILDSKQFYAVISLLAAVLIWSILVASDGSLTREKVFQNVAVSVTGETTLKSRGYIVMDDLNEIISGVKMTVEVSQSNYNRVSGTSYNPHIDLSDVTGEGENVLAVSFSSQLYGPVTKCEPATVTVNVEKYITRRIPVVLQLSGEAPAGAYLDSARTDPTSLSVSGPQSVVTRISRVVAKFDRAVLSDERMSDRIAVTVELQAADGSVIESDKVQITNQSVITDSVILETEMLPMKDVPLTLEEFVSGAPAEGYELYGVESAQTHISVAAPQEMLDTLDAFTTENPMDITGATDDVTGTVRLRRPTGMENAIPYDVTITAKIREKEIEQTIKAVEVDIDGLEETMSAALSRKQLTVQLTGAYSFINGLEKEDIRLFVDVTGLAEGEHTVPVQIHIDNAQPFTCALSAPELTVTLKAKE